MASMYIIDYSGIVPVEEVDIDKRSKKGSVFFFGRRFVYIGTKRSLRFHKHRRLLRERPTNPSRGNHGINLKSGLNLSARVYMMKESTMMFITEDMIKQSQILVEKLDEPLKKTFQNMHLGYQRETLLRFLKARDGNVLIAHKMLTDCLNWRIQNEIDCILTKPIVPDDMYRAIRDSQLVGMPGYTKEGVPVIAVGVGLSTYDKASIHYYVQSHIQMNEYRDRVILPSATKKIGRYIGTCIKILDMTGLKLSALNQIKLLSAISTIDDLNYPEKTDTYYIVNAPYIFTACWKVVKPLLHERTKKKVQVLSGSGRDDLLKIMDHESLPHFCQRGGSGSSKHSRNGMVSDCFSLDHPYHQQLYNYVKEQAKLVEIVAPVRHGSLNFPEPDPVDIKIGQTIKSEFQRLGKQNGIAHPLQELKITGQ